MCEDKIRAIALKFIQQERVAPLAELLSKKNRKPDQASCFRLDYYAGIL